MLIVNERWLVYHEEMKGMQVVYLDGLRRIQIDIEGNDNDIDNIRSQVEEIVRFIRSDFN